MPWNATCPATSNPAPCRGDLNPLLAVLSALVLLRVETVLLLLLFLALLSCTDDAASGRIPTLQAGLLAVGVDAVLHQTVVIAVYVTAGSSPGDSALGLLGVGIGALLTAAFAPEFIRARMLPADYAVFVLLAANAAYAILDRGAFSPVHPRNHRESVCRAPG